MFDITFYAFGKQTTIKVETLEVVRIIVGSCANTMVEWLDSDANPRWGDAVNGKAVTKSLACLLDGKPLPAWNEFFDAVVS